jgi:hypothetical protein
MFAEILNYENGTWDAGRNGGSDSRENTLTAWEHFSIRHREILWDKQAEFKQLISASPF